MAKTPLFLSHEDITRRTSTPADKAAATPQRPFGAAEPALALVEFASIAQGMLAADAMVKRATVRLIHAGTVQPGRYLVLLGGPVAEVEEALAAGQEAGPDALNDTVWLPGVHPAVLATIHAAGQPPPSIKRPADADALGIVETRTAPAAIHAADVAVKGASITLLSIRLADGLGGKGLVLLVGAVSDVEAALELVRERVSGVALQRTVVIPQLHADMLANIFGNTRFFRAADE